MRYVVIFAVLLCGGPTDAAETAQGLFMDSRELPAVARGCGKICRSPDGRGLYSAAYAVVCNEVLLCNPDDLKPKARLVGSYPIDLSKDGALLATASSTRNSAAGPHSFCIWNTQTGDLLTEVPYTGSLGTTGNWLHALAFSPDARAIAASSIFDNTIRIYDTQDGGTIGQLKGHTDDVFSLAFSHSGKLLVSGSRNGETILWDIKRMTLLSHLPKGTGIVSSMGFSPDDSVLAANDRDRVRVWDVANAEDPSLLFLKDDLWTYPNIAISPDGDILVVTKGQLVMFLDSSTGDEMFRVRAENYHPVRNAGALLRDIEFSPDGQTLFLAMGYGLQKVDLAKKELTVVTK